MSYPRTINPAHLSPQSAPALPLPILEPLDGPAPPPPGAITIEGLAYTYDEYLRRVPPSAHSFKPLLQQAYGWPAHAPRPQPQFVFLKIVETHRDGILENTEEGKKGFFRAVAFFKAWAQLHHNVSPNILLLYYRVSRRR